MFDNILKRKKAFLGSKKVEHFVFFQRGWSMVLVKNLNFFHLYDIFTIF